MTAQQLLPAVPILRMPVVTAKGVQLSVLL